MISLINTKPITLCINNIRVYSLSSKITKIQIFSIIYTNYGLLAITRQTGPRKPPHRRIFILYECVSISFRTDRLEQELQMVQLSATRCSCIAILWVSLMSFVAITLCVASERMFIFVSVYFIMTQSGNFWIHPHMPR
jgi:hypothetical protein